MTLTFIGERCPSRRIRPKKCTATKTRAGLSTDGCALRRGPGVRAGAAVRTKGREEVTHAPDGVVDIGRVRESPVQMAVRINASRVEMGASQLEERQQVLVPPNS